MHEPRILLTNDDGIHSHGLDILKKIALKLSSDVWVVAPKTEQSGASHSLTLSVPLPLREVESRVYVVEGTPSDCVFLGVRQLMQEHPPDLVLSGVNFGQNLAGDVTYSGTIAGAMEGTSLGIPAIALSQAIGQDGVPKWETAHRTAPKILKRLLDAGWEKDVFLNINFPDTHEIAGIKITLQGRRKKDFLTLKEVRDVYERPYYWLGVNLPELMATQASAPEGTDLHAHVNNYVSITPLHLNLSHRATREALQKIFP